MPEQYKYGGSLYKGGEGRAGVLDKNYYKDLGFSASKAGAQKTRGMLKGFGEEVAKREEQISGYEGKIKKTKADVEGKVKTAWKDYATGEVNLAGKTWNLPPEEAIKLGQSLGKYYHTDITRIPEMSEEQKKLLATKPPSSANIDAHQTYLKNRQKVIQQYAEEHKSDFLTGFTPPRGQSYNVNVGGVWTRKYRPVSKKAVEKSKQAHIMRKASDALAAAEQGKKGVVINLTKPKQEHAKAYFKAITEQVDPQVAKARAAYEKEYRAQAGKATSELDKQLLEAAKARGVLSSDMATVEGQKRAIVEKQKGRRTGMAETFNSLFRQRGKR